MRPPRMARVAAAGLITAGGLRALARHGRTRAPLQALDRGSADGSAVILARDGRGHRQALMLPQAFVSEKEKRLVFPDGTAEIRAKIISLERVLHHSHRIEEVACIEGAVAEEFKGFAVVLIGAGARGHVHDGAGIPPVLSGE